MNEEILEKLKDEPPRGRSKLFKYRSVLVEMKKKFFTQREMCEYLAQYGVEVSQSTLSEYLSRHPFTATEFDSPRIKHRKKINKPKQKVTKTIDLESWKNSVPDKKENSNKIFNVDTDKPY